MQRLFLHWKALGQAVEEEERAGLGGETQSCTVLSVCGVVLGLTVCGDEGFVLGAEATVHEGRVGVEQHRHQVVVTCDHLHSRLLSTHPDECVHTHTHTQTHTHV